MARVVEELQLVGEPRDAGVRPLELSLQPGDLGGEVRRARITHALLQLRIVTIARSERFYAELVTATGSSAMAAAPTSPVAPAGVAPAGGKTARPSKPWASQTLINVTQGTSYS